MRNFYLFFNYKLQRKISAAVKEFVRHNFSDNVRLFCKETSFVESWNRA